jgi:aminoglycoside phosphotransferase (APT) family kinase protein
MSFADIYLQPDAPDPVLDEATVLEAVHRHTPAATQLLRVDESGGEARAYHFDGDIVLKTQRPHRLRPRTNLEKEALFLRTLHAAGDFPVPQLFGYGRIDDMEYLCLSRMPGAAVRNSTLDPAQRAAALDELGRTLRRVHQIDQAPLTTELLPGDEGPAGLRARFADTFERLTEALEAHDDWNNEIDLAALASERLAATPDGTEPIALHSNPGPEHTFVDPYTGAFTGVIDFGDAYRSHPALDLRPWADDTDATNLLAGYRSLGPLPESFDDVWLTGRVIMELARASRGMKTPAEATTSIERLLT